MNNKITIPNNALILMVGIPGSGKSTLAKRVFSEDALHVSSDECRKEISGSENDQSVSAQAFELYYKKIEKGLDEGKQVIADATNTDSRTRARLYSIAKEKNVPVYAIILNIPLSESKRQNKMRNRVVPEEVIERQFRKLEIAYRAIEEELPRGHIIDIVLEPKRRKEEYDR